MRVMYGFYRSTVLYHGALFTNGINANRSNLYMVLIIDAHHYSLYVNLYFVPE